MLDNLSKIADKAFIFGFFLPTLAGLFAVCALFADVPMIGGVSAVMLHDKSLADLTLLALALWCAAVLLAMCNRPIYRLLEGYTGPLSWFGRRDAFRRAWRDRKAWLDTQFEQVQAAADGAPELIEYQRQHHQFRRDFPPEERLVLPSRFGNTLRAFESYPRRVYGAEGVVVWTRLSAVVPADFQSALADARAQVDLAVNATIISAALLLLSLGRALYATLDALHSRQGAGTPLYYLAAAVAASFIARSAYGLAVDRAVSWGELVKSTFDLYLPKLAEQLGHDAKRGPAGRAFWEEKAATFLYAAPPPEGSAQPCKPAPKQSLWAWLSALLR